MKLRRWCNNPSLLKLLRMKKPSTLYLLLMWKNKKKLCRKHKTPIPNKPKRKHTQKKKGKTEVERRGGKTPQEDKYNKIKPPRKLAPIEVRRKQNIKRNEAKIRELERKYTKGKSIHIVQTDIYIMPIYILYSINILELYCNICSFTGVTDSTEKSVKIIIRRNLMDIVKVNFNAFMSFTSIYILYIYNSHTKCSSL